MLSFSSGASSEVSASAKRALVPPMSATSTGCEPTLMPRLHCPAHPRPAAGTPLRCPGPTGRRGRVPAAAWLPSRHRRRCRSMPRPRGLRRRARTACGCR
ncbi:hypothetical protein G6F57_022975 [Rhizopus arrhizus]|nr:hypothetical protein G6F57_022975 [Rhizopus arrhizus]